MRKSFSWRVIGIGTVAGLIWIGFELGDNSRFSPTSSSVLADDSAASRSASKPAQLDFTIINAPGHGDLNFERAKVPGGWIVMVRQLNSSKVDGFTFVPDPRHTWDAASDEEQAERRTPRVDVDQAPPRIFGPAFTPADAAAKALKLHDTNKDGKLSKEELDQAPGLKAALKVMGADKEKGVTADQIASRVQKWRDSRIGRTSLSCLVTRNGQPLAGATVKFIPEKFLSDALKETATGITNQTGMTMLSVPIEPGPDAMPPGLPPGMYRVEITKDGENIPAKYNTNTELGQEVSLDNMDMQMGIKFNLKY
jgi:hypothetical protein